MYKILIISFLAAFACFPLCGETKTYWDAIRPYHKMTHIYWNVRTLNSDSPRYEEFTKALNEFKINALKLQNKADENMLGNDLMFDKYAQLLEIQIGKEGYNRLKSNYKSSAGVALKMDELPISHIFLLLSNDLKTMREAGIHNFPTPEIHKEWIPVYQYIRLYNYFREHVDRIERFSANYAWGSHFDNRMEIMLQCSIKVQKILKDKMPDLVKFSNIETETRVLLAYSRVARKNNSIGDSDMKRFTTLRSGGKKAKEKYDREMKRDMRLAMRNIERILNRFSNQLKEQVRDEQREKEQAKQDKLRQQQQAERDKQAKEAKSKREAAEEEARKRRLSAQERAKLNKMNNDELAENLAKRYNEVFPADHAKNISQSNVQKCLDMLTDSQKEYYENVKARYMRTGSSKKQAELRALKTVRPLLSTKNLRPTRKEMIRLLNNQ